MKPSVGKKDCLGPMLDARDAVTNQGLPLEIVVSESMVFMFAGAFTLMMINDARLQALTLF